MRISRKIGLSFFITFLLVILLGGLSIYSLRRIYKGLDQVFSKELPASRITYQIAISMEDVLSELNNFLITSNENFKADYERSYNQMQDNIARLKNFIVGEEEKALFEKIKELAGDIDDISRAMFKDTLEARGLIKDAARLEIKYKDNLYKLFDFEENKMLSEKDLLLINAQHIPASQLIIDAKSKLSEILDNLMQYALTNPTSEIAYGDFRSRIADELSILNKYISDYKNYHGYSLSDTERSIASELLDLSADIKSQAESIVKLKSGASAQLDSLFAKEKEIMDTLDKIISLRKARISSRLGIGATLTEDIPAVHNISKIEKDVSRSWRLSGKYIITGDNAYKNSYYELRQAIEREFKDYEVHARLRDRGEFLEDIMDADKGIAGNIDSGMDVFNNKGKGYKDIASMKSELQKKIGKLSERNDSLIREAREPEKAFSKLVPVKWALARLGSEVSDAERLVINYLCDQDKAYKDIYSKLYFDMKNHASVYRNSAMSDKDIELINEIESGLDKLNFSILNVMDSHDKIIRERGWDLIKLEDELKSNLEKAVSSELKQIEKNKIDIRNRIATINTLIFLIMAAVAFIAVFVVFYATKSITNPIQELYTGAELIGSGNLDHRLNIKTGDEIEKLAQGFNRMAGELKGLYTNLENKVKERTAQLANAYEELSRTNNEIALKKDEVEKTNAKLMELDRMKSDFVANVVHELRTPLAIIKGNLDNIDKGFIGEVQPEQKEILGDVFRVISRLSRLVNDLLDLSKIESGKMELNKEDLDIITLAAEVVKTFETLAGSKKIGLIKEFPDRAVIVNADRDKLTQVFINLIGNAIKFTDKGNAIVRIVSLQDEAQVEIQDTGPGIPQDQVDKIFDKFVRVIAEKKEGTGLGLPITKDIIVLHKGRIRIESEIGKGSRFIFVIPKVKKS